ncbi:hypothetical protein LCGC14_1397520 [marine sediment metagenome]|uniref:Uncharacterized protein n=1 Tax=marine sediment metagenome TaxID=412755 RepID=A0A0F9JY51_9ZZZZ
MYYYKIVREVDGKRYSLSKKLDNLEIEYKLGRYNFPNLLSSRIFVYASCQDAMTNLEAISSLPWSCYESYELWRIKAIDPRRMIYYCVSMDVEDIRTYWIKWRFLRSAYKHIFGNRYTGCKAIKLVERVL